MALTQLTKIDGGGISTTSDYRVGVITATKFIGPFEGSTGTFSGNITAVDGTFSGNVTVGGTLTYEDVTNIDSVGILTARAGIFIDDSITHIGDTNTKIRFPSADTVTVETGGTERFRIDSGGDTAFSGNIQIPDTIQHTGDTNTKIRFPAADTITAETGGTERLRIDSTGILKLYGDNGNNSVIYGHRAGSLTYILGNQSGSNDFNIKTWASSTNIIFSIAGNNEKVRIDSSGRLLITSTTSRTVWGANPQLQIEKLDSNAAITVIRNQNNAGGPWLALCKSRGTSNGAVTIVQDGDSLGSINWFGADGVDLASTSAEIRAEIDGTPGENDLPGRIIFKTTADGASSATERLRIDSSGNITQGIAGSATFSVINSISANAARGIEIHKDGTDTGSAIKLAGDNGSGTKAWSQLGYSGANATAHWANYNTAGQKVGEIQIGNTGNIGIGDRTSSPDADLHVHTASGESTIHVQAATNANLNLRAHSGDSTVKFSDGSASNLGNINYDHGTDSLSFRVNSSTRLTIDSSGHITPNDAGAQDLGSTSKEFRNLYLGDQGKVYFGLDQDMTMEFDSSNANISLNAGSLSIINYANNEDVKILSDNGSGGVTNYIIADGGSGEVLLHHYGSQKLSTSTTGISVTGEVAASQDYPTIRPTLDLNFAAVKKLDPRITYSRTGPASYVDEFGKVVLVSGNVPRFDHDPTTRECKGLLIEDSRINILPYSTNVVGNSSWSRAGVLTENTTAVTAPDGSYDAVALRDNGANSQHTLYDDVAIGNITSVYTSSCWIKAGSQSYGEIFVNGTGATGTVTIAYKFNLSTGAATYTGSGGFQSGTSAIATEYPNGWWRCSVTADVADSASGSGTFRWHVRPRTDSNGNYQGDDSIGLYVWGLQLELGTFPTSYIPGSSDGETVTRGADLALIDGEEFTDFFNQDEGTINCAYWLGDDNIALRVFQINDSNNSVIDIVAGSGSGSGGYGYVSTGGSAQANGGQSSTNANYLNKLHVTTLAYKTNDIAGINRNTGVLTNDTSATLDGAYNRVTFYQGANGADQLNGHLQRVQYYPKRLPDNQLKNLNNQ